MVSKSYPKVAGTIVTMILEASTEEVISYLEDPRALEKIIGEAHYLISAPPVLNSRPKSTSDGSVPGTSLSAQESDGEGGRNDDQQKL